MKITAFVKKNNELDKNDKFIIATNMIHSRASLYNAENFFAISFKQSVNFS